MNMMYHSAVQIELDNYLDLSDAAKNAEIAIWRLKRACESGKLPHIEFNTRILVSKSDFDVYMSSKRPGRPAKRPASS